jgi:hypothetical protein
VTSSSQNVSTSQLAVKAVDGVINGYPGDSTREWATVGGKAGSWLKLTWNYGIQLNKVVLYDRPNLSDQVTSAMLTFSDGSSVTVPALANDAKATTVSFPTVSTTSLVITVTSVSTTTKNVGLAEIQAYTPAQVSGIPAAVASGWTPLGEPGVGGRVTGMAVNPANSADLLVGGDMLGIGLSEDGGHTWQATSGLVSWEINAFTWDPVHTNVVWVGTQSGPYRSVDGGHTWSPMRVGMPTGDYPYSAPVQKVLIDPSDPTHLLAVGGNQRQFTSSGSGALNYGLVYESHDTGAHWTTIANIGTNWNILDVVAGGSANLQTLYAAVLGQGVYRSSDGGHTWAPMNAGMPNLQALALASDPAHPSTVWAAVGHDPSATNGV